MVSAGRSPERAHTETFPPAFLFSQQMPLWDHLLTASPRGKRQALTRRCVSNLGSAYRCSRAPQSPCMISLTCVGALRPFSRGEGGPAKPGRKRNGEMVSAGRSPERAHTETFPPAFLFSQQMPLWDHLLTASPRGKRQALTRRCVSNLGSAYRCSSTPGSPHIKGEFFEGIKAAPMIFKQLDKLGFVASSN